ncbi:hypothetical protein [Micromonospora mirobrigensis]|uniref:hypothetical protein n=1 Tax=Micromonospora mirobrigensis TaxID=262898 RepID=UPI001FE009AA|nr:hypothetical protein [Micromonospora mirobrigensis]
MRVWRCALRVGLVLAGVLSAGAVVAPPAQAAPGFATELSGLPDEFAAGDGVRTVSAVVSRTDGGGCLKVRWSLVLSVRGLRLDQVRVDRVEDSGSFPLDVRADGDVARLTDRQLDPGTLCPDRTVTARYRVAFAGDVAQGRVTLAAEAYDEQLRLLARQTATRSVLGGSAPTAEPTVEPTAEGVPTVEPTARTVPTEEPVEEESTPAQVPAAEPPPAGGDAGRPVSRAGGFGVVQAAFLLGGLLLFLGVGLLLRLRSLVRTTGDEEADAAPAGRGWERVAPAAAGRGRRWRPARH